MDSMKNPSLQPPASNLSFTISPAIAGQRLDKALTLLAAETAATAPELLALSRARLQALLAEGHVTLNDKPIDDASRKVKEGEIYALHLPPPEAPNPKRRKSNSISFTRIRMCS